MPSPGHQPVRRKTRRIIQDVFRRLDYSQLGPIYCDEGGEAFWRDRRDPCERLGCRIATALKALLSPQGKSLYVGAGVAELPACLMELNDLDRMVSAHNLRHDEVRVLNRACQHAGLQIIPTDARDAAGPFDHMWLVSVLNDPERFPHLSDLSYGRAHPLSFDPRAFQRERQAVMTLINALLKKLTLPGLITTSVEELPWIVHWCEARAVSFSLDPRTFPTALVGDPICFIRVDGDGES